LFLAAADTCAIAYGQLLVERNCPIDGGWLGWLENGWFPIWIYVIAFVQNGYKFCAHKSIEDSIIYFKKRS
jgi:hypothetical protein